MDQSNSASPTGLDYLLGRSQNFPGLTVEEYVEVIDWMLEKMRSRMKYMTGFGRIDPRFTRLFERSALNRDMHVVYGRFTELYVLTRSGHWWLVEVDIDFTQVLTETFVRDTSELTTQLRQYSELGPRLIGGLVTIVADTVEQKVNHLVPYQDLKNDLDEVCRRLDEVPRCRR